MIKGKSKIKISSSYNSLTVISFSHRDGNRKYHWNCNCICGNAVVVSSNDLTSNHTKSCGCLKTKLLVENRTTHGKSNSAEYSVWCGIIKRTENKNNHHYSNYGGRGIVMCESWRKSFDQFLIDMGARPSPKHSIERKNNDGNYEPDNCIWSTNHNQSRNKRNNVLIEYQGEVKILQDWANQLKITRDKFKTVIKNNSQYKILKNVSKN